MGIFFWKNNKKIDELAGQLAQDFFNTLSPQAIEKYNIKGVKDKVKNKKNKDMQRALNNAITMINNFKPQLKLGVYGKARLHMKFKDRLHELGYKDDLIEDVDKYIMLRTA